MNEYNEVEQEVREIMAEGEAIAYYREKAAESFRKAIGGAKWGNLDSKLAP